MQKNIHLPKDAKYVFLLGSLGDSLIEMIVINQFVKAGYDATVFSDTLYELQHWFPHIKISKVPKDEKTFLGCLQTFDQLILFHHEVKHFSPSFIPLLKKNPIIFEKFKQFYADNIPIASIHKNILENYFDFKHVSIDNGLIPPSQLTHRKFKNRVVMHVTAGESHRAYLPKRFIKLADKLKTQGFDCYFIVAPFEYKHWVWVKKQGIKLPQFSSLDKMASFIYESGYFIGNDSGLGHLASNLGIPTLSLFIRSKLYKRWRPIWGLNLSIIAPPILVLISLKMKYWKYLIPWQQVYFKFRKLLNHDRN